jgi:hypothetical protein
MQGYKSRLGVRVVNTASNGHNGNCAKRLSYGKQGKTSYEERDLLKN